MARKVDPKRKREEAKFAEQEAKYKREQAAHEVVRQKRINDVAVFREIVSVDYISSEDGVLIEMASGVLVQIPRALIPELTNATQEILEGDLEIGPMNNTIVIESLDTDIWVPLLLKKVLGFKGLDENY